MSIQLGSKARCKITNHEGVVTAHSKHLHGCDRYWVQAPIDKDGKMRDGYWFDEAVLEILEVPEINVQVIPKNPANPLKPGGPHSRIK